MRRPALALLFAAAAFAAACSDGTGNSLSTGVGGTARARHGWATR